jgi:hypothetical protein
MSKYLSAALLLAAMTIPCPADEPNGLTAVLSPGKEPNTVLVEYRNGTTKEVTTNSQVLTSGILALQVIDRTGRVVPPVPPPTPLKEDPGIRIPAGGVHRMEYPLNHFIPRLAPGRYRVRCRVTAFVSEPIEIEIVEQK